MIQQILDLLQIDDFYGKSELIDIAKGKFKMPMSYKEKKEQVKRKKAWQLKEQ